MRQAIEITWRFREPSLAHDEVPRADFKLEAGAAFLRNPTDPRDWNDSPRAAGERAERAIDSCCAS